MIIQFNLLYIFLRLILIVVFYIIPLDTYSVEAEETNAEKIKIRKEERHERKETERKIENGDMKEKGK